MTTYAKQLPNTLADDYLNKRRFTDQTKQRFELGFRSTNNNQNQFGKLHIPIRNHKGELVSYAERVLDNSSPKYVNGAATALYNKSALLYGFNLMPYFSDLSRIYVVEGYSDVWRMHERGLFAVAICGTALTEEQLALLFSVKTKIILALDNDDAGKLATLRAIKLIAEKHPKKMESFLVWDALAKEDTTYNDVADYLQSHKAIESVTTTKFMQSLSYQHHADRLFIANKLASKGNYKLVFDLQGTWA